MNKINLKLKKLFTAIILIIFILGLCFSIYKIITYKMDENKINKQLDLIDNAVKVSDVNDTSKVEIIKQDEITESDPYWDYINMNLIDVDFSKLKSINKNTKGWIKVNGTNINYPFVQTDNNDYYLNHSFDNSYNYAGWVFLDYRNNISNFDNKNTIIYAHGMYNNTMFGSLRNILTNGWLDNTNNYVIKLSTEKENTLWQAFSVYVIPTTNDYIKVNFNSNDEFKEFANMLLNRSEHNFNTTISENDRILTLSTCYNKTNKVVLHAKLIKREEK